MPYKLLGARSR